MAGCKLYQLIIEEFQQQFWAVNDADFPQIILLSYPFADMLSIESMKQNKQLLIEQLQYCFDKLVDCNAEVIAIACNTLHTLLPEISIPDVEFVDIVQATMAAASARQLSKLLILATSTTVGLNLYNSSVLSCCVPSSAEQRVVDDVIKSVLASNTSDEDILHLQRVIQSHDANGLVLGCTELPLIFDRMHNNTTNLLILNTLRILAKEIVKKSCS